MIAVKEIPNIEHDVMNAPTDDSRPSGACEGRMREPLPKRATPMCRGCRWTVAHPLDCEGTTVVAVVAVNVYKRR